jgi:hypothetical protein
VRIAEEPAGVLEGLRERGVDGALGARAHRDLLLVQLVAGAAVDETWVDVMEAERLIELLAPEGVREGSPVDFEKLRSVRGSNELVASIQYAIRYPERVARLILYVGYARVAYLRGTPGARATCRAMIDLARAAWVGSNDTFRHVFTSRFIPGWAPGAVLRKGGSTGSAPWGWGPGRNLRVGMVNAEGSCQAGNWQCSTPQKFSSSGRQRASPARRARSA